jgi:hypothetical protein
MVVMNKFFSIFLFFFVSIGISAQTYRTPVTIPVALSGNFGELRSNNFHSGIDFKTQQVVNKPIVSIADGYVSRISISPGGYGLALYINHPETGHTSVYAHLNSFSRAIADYVIAKQYELESFSIDIRPQQGLFPVRAGEQIGLSGNTGSSSGPHLHFEIRDTHTQDALDPLAFITCIPDTQSPDLRGIAFYPKRGKGVINDSQNPIRITIRKDQSGKPLALGREINAWGRVGVGVKAYDRMNGQSNIYGVKHVRLFVDDEKVFSSSIERFPFDKRRILNTFIDYEDWRQNRSLFMRSFIEPGNTLPFYQQMDGTGFIDINEQRIYRLRYELEDHYGNVLTYPFIINGQPQMIEELPLCQNVMHWNFSNAFVDYGFLLTIQRGNLYTDFCFTHSKTENPNFLSDVHQVNHSPVPLHNQAEMWIKLNNNTPQNKSNLGVVRIAANGNQSWIGGQYSNGGVKTTIRELGDRYAITTDTISPTITPLEPTTWANRQQIRIRLSDNLSGIASFRGEINGQFILFTHDMKSPIYTYTFDDSRLPQGKSLVLTFTATDNAGNEAEYRWEF